MMTKEQKEKIYKGLECCKQAEPLCTECPYVDVPRCHFILAKDVADYLAEEDEP